MSGAMWIRPCQAPATIMIVGFALGGFAAAAMAHCGQSDFETRVFRLPSRNLEGSSSPPRTNLESIRGSTQFAVLVFRRGYPLFEGEQGQIQKVSSRRHELFFIRRGRRVHPHSIRRTTPPQDGRCYIHMGYSVLWWRYIACSFFIETIHPLLHTRMLYHPISPPPPLC